MNGIKKIANICESTGVKAATTMLNQQPQRFVAGFNLDYVGRISKFTEYYYDKNENKSVCDMIAIDYVIGENIVRHSFVQHTDSEYAEFDEFLDSNKMSSIGGIYNELKKKISE